MANDPNRREIWYHTNAATYFSVFHCRRTPFVSVTGSTVAQQVNRALAEGAFDNTSVGPPNNVHFLEGLPEDPA